jgi:hypothetical protein
MCHVHRENTMRQSIISTFASLASCVMLLALTSSTATACTTAVVSGKATIDGRPLLWKNRDAPHRDNQVRFFADGKYRCVAVVNAGSTGSVWMGVNDQGFCIENSLSKDLAEEGSRGPGNGGFMLRALQNCATVEDFEALLQSTNGHRSTTANYGVIDGRGGAVLFETAASSYRKFDANDPVVAPRGYVVRSNFAFKAQPSDPSVEDIAKLYSGERYLRGCRLMDQAIQDGGVSVRYIVQHCARDLADRSGTPIVGSINGEFGDLPDSIDTTSTISRKTSVSAVVFRGVLPGEDPRLTTMWVLLGEPAFSVAVPCWVGAEGVAEELLGAKRSRLCDAVKQLRDEHYRDPADKAKSMLLPETLPDIWQQTLPLEREFLEQVENRLTQWRLQPPSREEMLSLHESLARRGCEAIEALQPVAAGVGR